MELADPPEQPAAGHIAERLSRQHEGHLFPVLREPGEDLERRLRGGCTDDVVAACVAITRLPLNLAERGRVGVDG
jgi:hypothetical protein